MQVQVQGLLLLLFIRLMSEFTVSALLAAETNIYLHVRRRHNSPLTKNTLERQ